MFRKQAQRILRRFQSTSSQQPQQVTKYRDTNSGTNDAFRFGIGALLLTTANLMYNNDKLLPATWSEVEKNILIKAMFGGALSASGYIGFFLGVSYYMDWFKPLDTQVPVLSTLYGRPDLVHYVAPATLLLGQVVGVLLALHAVDDAIRTSQKE